MIIDYKYGQSCYLIQEKEFLEMIVPQQILSMFGYPEMELKMQDVLVTWKELPDGRIAHNVQIAPYSNNKLGSTAANNPMTKQQFELAKIQYKVKEFYSMQEYKELTPINEELI